MQKLYVVGAVLILLLGVVASLGFNSLSSKVTQESPASLPTSFSFLVKELSACSSDVNAVTAALAGTTAPGACCKKNSDCWSGSCACKRGPQDTSSRCCHYSDGRSCQSNGECQSNSCVNGKCQAGKRANGSACSVNEDCTSGMCRGTGPNGTWICTT